MEYGVCNLHYAQIMSPSSTTPSYLNTQNVWFSSIKDAARELDSVSHSLIIIFENICCCCCCCMKVKRGNPKRIEFFDKMFVFAAYKCIERNAKNAKV